MTRIAIYPGSFDPPTKGHEDLIRRSLALADQVIVAVAVNPSKQPLFPVAERIAMLRATVGDDPRVTFESFDGLLAEFARKVGASVVVRGLRAVSDFEYEYQMALTNRTFAQDIETIFVMTHEEYSFVSSRLIKEAASLGGDISSFVPKEIERWIRKKYSEGTKIRKPT